MSQQIEKRIKIFVRSHGSRYDDFVDRLSSRYTVIMLVGFAVVVTLLSKACNPINCWAPNHFSSSKAKFANNYCWVKNTYYLPWEKEIPKESEARQWILYYQWVPFNTDGTGCSFPPTEAHMARIEQQGGGGRG